MRDLPRLRAELLAHARYHWAQLRLLGVPGVLRWHRGLVDAWLKEKGQRHRYRVLTEEEARGARRSDTVFVFGSGYSLHDVPAAAWRHFEEHDTLGLSGFVYAPWVRVDYHLIRGWNETDVGSFKWRRHTQEFADVLSSNPRFQETILVLQGEYLAEFCNALVGHRFLREGTRILRYHNARAPGLPTRRLADGLRHDAGTLADAVNFAYALGWKRIVLVGVDLYDNRYFWLKPDQTLDVDAATGALRPGERTARGLRYDQRHNTVRNGIVETMGRWREAMARDGVELMVYNPRSLLRATLPQYTGAPLPASPPTAPLPEGR